MINGYGRWLVLLVLLSILLQNSMVQEHCDEEQCDYVRRISCYGDVRHRQNLLFMDGVPFLIELRQKIPCLLMANVSCLFCDFAVESSSHLIFPCPFSYGVWTSIYSWLFFALRMRPQQWIISCNTVIWSSWMHRNKCI
jgi:hypothetical protein